jgi:hypothetical protein
MWRSRIAVGAVTVAVLGLGLAALFSTGSGSGTNPATVEVVGVANPPGGITVRQSEITIPNVMGESVTQAAQSFFSLGFEAVYAANIAEPGATPGTVLEQSPAGGSKGTLDETTIHLTIAKSAAGSVRIVPHRKG